MSEAVAHLFDGDGVKHRPLRVSDGNDRSRVRGARRKKQPAPERFLVLFRHHRSCRQRLVPPVAREDHPSASGNP